MIQRMLDAGVTFVEEEKEEKPKILEGLTFVFTGTLKSMTRDEAKEKVRELGGKTTDSVSKNIDYVVVGEDPGSKYQKALQLGVKTINEEEFLKLIGETK
jgi:DNA ligase (NAD+)